MAVAVTVSSIEAVFNILGAVTGTSLSIFMPGYFYVSQISKKNKEKGLKFYLAWGIMAVMLPYAIFSIVAKYLPE